MNHSRPNQATSQGLTAIGLAVLTHCYYDPEPLPNSGSVAQAIRELARLGAIEPREEPGAWRCTELGRAWVEKLKATPCPELPKPGDNFAAFSKEYGTSPYKDLQKLAEAYTPFAEPLPPITELESDFQSAEIRALYHMFPMLSCGHIGLAAGPIGRTETGRPRNWQPAKVELPEFNAHKDLVRRIEFLLSNKYQVGKRSRDYFLEDFPAEPLAQHERIIGFCQGPGRGVVAEALARDIQRLKADVVREGKLWQLLTRVLKSLEDREKL